MSLKILHEHLCRRQIDAGQWPTDVREAVADLLDLIDVHRPLAANGKHGDLHTNTCGCEDKPTCLPDWADTWHPAASHCGKPTVLVHAGWGRGDVVACYVTGKSIDTCNGQTEATP